MKKSFFILPLLVFSFTLSFSGLCAGKDQDTALTVKKVTFTRLNAGAEKIALSCNQSCVPEVFSIDNGNPRVVLDLKGVSLMQAKDRNISTSGKFVKRIRLYLDRETKNLRITLDMDPSKYYMVRPAQEPSGHAYTLTIHELMSFPEQKPGEIKGAGGTRLAWEKRIHIYRPNSRPGEADVLQEAVPLEKSGVAKVVKDKPSLGQGRMQLDTSAFAEAADTFTSLLATHPYDSLVYRLRGNAYDNLGDRQKAVEDWTQAARLGDTTLQSYLDFLKIQWRVSPAL